MAANWSPPSSRTPLSNGTLLASKQGNYFLLLSVTVTPDWLNGTGVSDKYHNGSDTDLESPREALMPVCLNIAYPVPVFSMEPPMHPPLRGVV